MIILSSLVLAAPSIDTISLNSTDPTSNDVDQNLTAQVTTSNSNKTIYNWYVNDNSLTILNMPFEGGSNNTYTKDYSGHEHNVSVHNTPYLPTGGHDGFGAYSFDNDNVDNIEIENFDMGDLGMRSFFSVETYLRKMESTVGWYNTYAVSMWNSGASSGTNQWALLLADGSWSDTPKVVIEIDNTIYGATYGTDMTIGEWYHLVGTYDNETLRFYVNGNLVDSNTDPSGPINDVNRKLLIGDNDGQTPIYGATMNMSYLRIYNHTLSPEQIEALHNNRTDLIVSQETSNNEQWHFEAAATNSTAESAFSTSNTITIGTGDSTPEPDPVPEFSDYAIAFLLMTVAGGFIYMRRKEAE